MAHASWAVAGWFTVGRFPAKGVVAAVGVWRRWRMCMISSVVRVVVGGGACGVGGGGVVMAGCWCDMWVVWVDVGGCVCVLV
jgi:hypothetical protein